MGRKAKINVQELQKLIRGVQNKSVVTQQFGGLLCCRTVQWDHGKGSRMADCAGLQAVEDGILSCPATGEGKGRKKRPRKVQKAHPGLTSLEFEILKPRKM